MKRRRMENKTCKNCKWWNNVGEICKRKNEYKWVGFSCGQFEPKKEPKYIKVKKGVFRKLKLKINVNPKKLASRNEM